MTKQNNENTKLASIENGWTSEQSLNNLPLMIACAGLIGYTFYHKYTKHCSLDGKTAIFSSQWIESTDPNVPGKINLDVKINKTAEKNIFTLSPNGLDETWGTFNFQGQEIIIGKDGINTAEIVRAPNGNLSVTFLFNTVSFVIPPLPPLPPLPVTLNLPTLTYTLYPSKFNKNNFAGFTTSGSDLTLPFPPIKYLIAGKGQLKINH
jgi:hypothetical protein